MLSPPSSDWFSRCVCVWVHNKFNFLQWWHSIKHLKRGSVTVTLHLLFTQNWSLKNTLKYFMNKDNKLTSLLNRRGRRGKRRRDKLTILTINLQYTLRIFTDFKLQQFKCSFSLCRIVTGVEHTCTATRSSSHWGQDGACPQSAAHPPPLSGHLSAVEPTAEAAQLLLGYGFLWTQKHATHFIPQKTDWHIPSQKTSTFNNAHAVKDMGGRIQAVHSLD